MKTTESQSKLKTLGKQVINGLDQILENPNAYPTEDVDRVFVKLKDLLEKCDELMEKKVLKTNTQT